MLQLATIISGRSGMISHLSQLGSMLFAALLGRFYFRSRIQILLVAFLGACGAMFANVLVDGQGTFMFRIFTPAIYFAAVAGRYDLG